MKIFDHRLASFTLMILVIFCCSQVFATDDGEFQYWNTESVSTKLNDDWKVKLEEEFRLGDDGGNLYYQHSDLGFTYSGLTDWLDLGFNYRQIFEKKSGEWKEEERPHLNATVNWKWLDYSFSNRVRFEYREREDSQDYWRYRNKFTIKLPLKITKFEIQPYIADEIFCDFNHDELNKNRLYSGFALKLLDNLKSDIFFLWQSSESNDEWSDIYTLGTKLQLSF
ncbi:MAG: DUF2490 domain-containing protein [Candidatus Omnitrophota bacterium]